jgi:hypothetical protein
VAVSPKSSSALTGGVPGNSVLHASTWSGVVFALVCLLCVLNIVPPIEVAYQFKTQVILSPARLQQLKFHAEQMASEGGAVTGGRLKRIEVLDRLTSSAASGEKKLVEPEVLLVEVTSLWNEQQKEAHLYEWIEKASTVPLRQDGDSLARQLRFQRWQLAAVEHYEERQRYVDSSGKGVSAGGRSFQLASTARGRDGKGSLNGHEADEASVLSGQVAQARQQLSSTLASWERHVEEKSGAFRPAGRHKVEAKPSRIPSHFAASVLVIGLAAGATAGWFQFRLQSSQVYAPAGVAAELSRDGLPCVASLVLPGSSSAEGSGIARGLVDTVAELPRRVARRFARLNELTLLGWCGLIGFRFIAEPMWRDMLTHSPLAAFGRLISGLP